MNAKRIIWLAIAGALPIFAQPSLVLTPGGPLTGSPGSTVGWGFTLANTTPGRWIEVTSVSFCLGTSGVTTACVPSAAGSFTDFMSAFNDVVVGSSPNTTVVSQPFDLTAHRGVGSFHLTGAGPTGLGQIVLTYDVFSRSPQDPAFDPGVDTVATDQFLTAAASVTAVAPVPALSDGAFTALAALIMAAGVWRARLAEKTHIRP